MRYRVFIALTCLLLIASVPRAGFSEQGKISIITSIFPLYEIAGKLGGDAVDVNLLLPPGTEPHTWDPRPSDIIRIEQSQLFIYMGPELEPWVSDVLQATAGDGLEAIEIFPIIAESSTENHKGHSAGPEQNNKYTDPHIWLDFSYACKIAEVVSEALQKKLPGQAETISANAVLYIEKLRALDQRYATELAKCRKNQFVFGGHSAFAYLANRYGLVQIPLYGISPDSEPSPRRLGKTVRTIKKLGLQVVYFEELLNPRLAQVIADETGAATSVLNPGANLTISQWKAGVTFISLMEQNLESLKKGLDCEQQ